MHFEVVSHGVQDAKLLSFQLSSLMLVSLSGGNRVKNTPCFTASDADPEVRL